MTAATLQGEPAGRWRQLAVLSLAVLGGMSVWFTATAVGPELAFRWSLSGAQSAYLTSAVQLGFVVGTGLAAILNLADVIPARPYFATAAFLAAGANSGLLWVDDYGPALALRFLTGLMLAGVYPPAMKMISTWFRAGRGLGIGVIVGALAVGKAGPYLLKLFGSAPLTSTVVGASAAAALGGAGVLVLYRDGPWTFPRRGFSWSRAGEVVRDRKTRLATLGYLAHMWELYAMWALIALFMTDAALFHGADAVAGARIGTLAGFFAIAAGGGGAVLAGYWADRWGRERVAGIAMALSGLCAMTLGWMIGAPFWLVASLAVFWGATVVADSAQFSALVTEVAPPHAVGTALTLQTMIGFALTAVAIPVASAVQATAGWGVCFSILAIGPFLGIFAMVALARSR